MGLINGGNNRNYSQWEILKVELDEAQRVMQQNPQIYWSGSLREAIGRVNHQLSERSVTIVSVREIVSGIQNLIFEESQD